VIENYENRPIPPKGQSVVYFVRVGKLVKIGTSRDLLSRLKSFLTTTLGVQFLLAVPGDRALERELHDLLSEARVARELFHHDGKIQGFIDIYGYWGMERAMRYLRESTPRKRQQKKEEDRRERVRVARQTKAERDAHCAALVRQRKQELGW